MRLEIVATPNPAHAGLADPLCRRHSAATPMRVAFRFGLQGGVNHALDSSHIITGFLTSPWSNLPKRLGPATAEALAPEADRLTVHAILSGDRHVSLSGGNFQNNAAEQRDLQRSSQGYQAALEFAALVH